MSDATVNAGPDSVVRALQRLGCTPSWRTNCSILPDKFGGFCILSADRRWCWSAQVGKWIDAKREDLGSFGSFEFAARALAACHTPPPGVAEGEREAWGLGQRAWLVNRATTLSNVAAGIEHLADDADGIKIALARPGHAEQIELSPIKAMVHNATRIIDACGRIASAARAAFGAAIESHSVTPADVVQGVGDDVMGVGIPLVDREPTHGGGDGNPQGRTDAPAALAAVKGPEVSGPVGLTEEMLAAWAARLYEVAGQMPRNGYYTRRVLEVCGGMDRARAKMEAARAEVQA